MTRRGPRGNKGRLAIWSHELIDRLGSGRLALWLLGLYVVWFALLLTLPQRGMVGDPVVDAWVAGMGWRGRALDAIGLTEVKASPLLYVTHELLFVNLLVCMSQRIKLVLRSTRLPACVPRPDAFTLQRTLERSGEDPVGRAEALLGQRGYRTLRAEGGVLGLRGRFALVGHWVFHFGLLMVLVAGFLSVLFPASFKGTVTLGEGEHFDLHRASFLHAAPAVSENLEPLRFSVRDVTFRVVEEDISVNDFAVDVVGDGGDETIGINRPYRAGDYQVLTTNFGYMPGWDIADPFGRILEGQWVKLAPFPNNMQDWVGLAGGEGRVDFTFFPDYVEADGRDTNRSYELARPRFHAMITWRGRAAYEGWLEPGQRVPLGGGLSFGFNPEIRSYCLLEVRQDEEHVLFFVAFGLALFGLVLRYARLRREIVVVEGTGGALEVGGRTELLEGLFEEELDAFCHALTGPDHETRKDLAA